MTLGKLTVLAVIVIFAALMIAGVVAEAITEASHRLEPKTD